MTEDSGSSFQSIQINLIRYKRNRLRFGSDRTVRFARGTNRKIFAQSSRSARPSEERKEKKRKDLLLSATREAFIRGALFLFRTHARHPRPCRQGQCHCHSETVKVWSFCPRCRAHCPFQLVLLARTHARPTTSTFRRYTLVLNATIRRSGSPLLSRRRGANSVKLPSRSKMRGNDLPSAVLRFPNSIDCARRQPRSPERPLTSFRGTIRRLVSNVDPVIFQRDADSLREHHLAFVGG